MLLDTCAAIWLLEDRQVSAAALSALDDAFDAAVAVYVSPISAWEVGMLYARRRLDLIVTPERWFARLLAIPGVRLAELPPAILIASSFLPGTPPRDPADRIIAATARDLGARLMTRDRPLLDYGQAGHISVLAC